MQHEARRVDLPGGLTVEPGRAPDEATLLHFALATPRTGAVGCGLEWLGGNLETEDWRMEAVVQSGRSGDIVWRRAGDLLFLALEWPDDPVADPREAVEGAYERLLSVADEAGCRHLLRAWNYLPAINAGDGDAERYRRFCLGRAAALEKLGYGDGELCAGTAIGSDEPLLRIYLLCAPLPGINIENPRQVSAYRYPRRYGPRSPSFARATAVAGANDSMLLMISGTASVVGHRSLHVDDVNGQLEEVIRNLETLLSESAQQLGRPGLAEFDHASLLRVYVRHARDWPMIERRLRERWPGIHLAGLRGDICRSDLLVEIEAVSRN
ncbi:MULTISPECIES: pteridine-dependent deoxygenase [unclassified Wenzhouxiangella]|uniref:chorismate transformation enzyme, FkbO/Hyg5 family n=1 Tax=unclassified Wenzhouxiangella TaxID=2613841 RepID=UPI000E32A629|nr:MULTISPECIES: pteridine-dependent deoxygenase [unclassified Wenzhouxiangella]RFF27425.1 pteridine-dependent deoxygenase [Wenzhouxiangella sp. 15181]RFP68853.1 pteridine-dependent deoxygenase [Wenzhouxiangella sp. 15190]